MAIKRGLPAGGSRVTLKTIADRLGLAIGTVSAALNDSPAAKTIPDHTKSRILEAARELNYQPNFLARSLRLQRTYTIGVITEQIGDPYGAVVISGIEEALRETEYLFLTVVHRHDQRILESYARMLMSRGVEGFITVDVSVEREPQVPTVAVAGHARVPRVTNLVLDEQRAARLALCHLQELGHTEIAFFRGQVSSSDSQTRWAAVISAAEELGIKVDPELVVQIARDQSTPELGYPCGQELLRRGRPFTALYAYNDLSAIGAIWAFQSAGLRVPGDVSVVGFDDVPVAMFSSPALTTIRQPLVEMGRMAARTLIDRIEGRAEFCPEIVIEPELIVRASTGPPPASGRALPLERRGLGKE